MKLYDSRGNVFNVDDNKEITRGGEGRIIELSGNKVAKLYLPGIEPMSESKFRSLSDIKSNLFVKPENILYDKKKIVGYVMSMVSDDHFPLFSVYNSNFCKRNNIDDNLKFKIAQKLIEAVQYIHKQDIIIGDLNPFNILINDKGSMSFIDVDSYQTPGNPHSGRLLDDIRDYLYHGRINKESDYFSLAVLIFNMLTNLHPFKGIHKNYPSMADRMIYKIPVFLNDNNLKIPKCYEPIQNPGLQSQFERIFREGERFIIDLKPSAKTIIKKKVKTIQKTNQLAVSELIENGIVKYINTSNNKLCIHLKDKTVIFDVATKGYHKTLGELDSSYETYPTDKHFYVSKNNELFYVNKDFTMKKVLNVSFNKPLSIHRYNNILVVVEKELMYRIYLDNVISNKDGVNVKVENRNVYGRSFRKYEGLIQNIGGFSYIYYNNNDTLNHIKMPQIVKDIYQIGDIGVVQYLDDEKIKYNMFKIKGMNMLYDADKINNMSHIGYKEGSYVVKPEDDAILILRPDDFSEISNFKCDLVSEDSQIFVTNAGIVCNDGENVYLLNTK